MQHRGALRMQHRAALRMQHRGALRMQHRGALRMQHRPTQDAYPSGDADMGEIGEIRGNKRSPITGG
jgi:hypothetical protein